MRRPRTCRHPRPLLASHRHLLYGGDVRENFPSFRLPSSLRRVRARSHAPKIQKRSEISGYQSRAHRLFSPTGYYIWPTRAVQPVVCCPQFGRCSQIPRKFRPVQGCVCVPGFIAKHHFAVKINVVPNRSIKNIRASFQLIEIASSGASFGCVNAYPSRLHPDVHLVPRTARPPPPVGHCHLLSPSGEAHETVATAN